MFIAAVNLMQHTFSKKLRTKEQKITNQGTKITNLGTFVLCIFKHEEGDGKIR